MSPRMWPAMLLLVAGARVAAADDTADCSYLEISATTGKDPAIDAELKPLEKKLKKPPFSSWNVFHKLSGGSFTLTKNKAENLKLSQGGASILLRDRTDKRLDLTITVDGADGKRVLDNKQSVNAGEGMVFGHNVKDDGHILALTCR